jgi:dihydroneopterin aldolase
LKDRVHGSGFSYDCRIGFHEFERHIRQRVIVDWEVETTWREAALADRAKSLVDYYQINLALEELVKHKEWRLVEAMAEDVAQVICTRFPVDRVRVRVTKMPFDMPNTQSMAVECWREPSDFEGIPDPLARHRDP